MKTLAPTPRGATHPPCGQAEALPVPIPGRDASVAEGDSNRIAREAMVQEQIEARGVRNAAVLAGNGQIWSGNYWDHDGSSVSCT